MIQCKIETNEKNSRVKENIIKVSSKSDLIFATLLVDAFVLLTSGSCCKSQSATWGLWIYQSHAIEKPFILSLVILYVYLFSQILVQVGNKGNIVVIQKTPSSWQKGRKGKQATILV